MNEKIYRTMNLTGAGSIVIGIILILVGITAGVLSIICGANLLQQKKNITF